MKNSATKIVALVTLSLLLWTSGVVRSLDKNDFKRRHTEILNDLKQGKLAQVEKALVELQGTAPQAFTRNSYDYLLARVRHRLGKIGAARQDYLKVVERKALVSEYVYWHLAEIARAAGDLPLERQYLERILNDTPESLLAPPSRHRIADSYAESQDEQRAIEAYAQLAKGRGSQAREAQLKLAQAQIRLGQIQEGRTSLLQLMANQTDDVALEAVKLLDEMDRRAKRSLTLGDLLQRARIYQSNRAFDEARRHYQHIVNRFPESPHVAGALYEMGRGYYQQGDADQAIVWYERVHDSFPQTRQGEQGFYQAGHAHARAERWDQAVKRYEDFIAAYPKSRTFSGAYLNAIDALRSAGKDAEALAWCERTIQRFPGELAATTALFSQARIHLSQHNNLAALADFDQLLRENLNRRGPRAPNRPEVTFMRGYCLEKLERYSDAIDVYLSLSPDRDNYYGYRATARLQDLMNNPKAKTYGQTRLTSFRQQFQSERAAGRLIQALDPAIQALRLTTDEKEASYWLHEIGQMYLRLPQYRVWNELQVQEMGRDWLTDQSPAVTWSHRTLASELLFLGLYTEGAPELAAVIRSTPRPTQAQWFTLAVLLNRGDYPGEAIRIGESQFASQIPQDYRMDLLPTDVAQTLYPVPYRTVLTQHAMKQNIDPRFVLALMRQESRFRADVKSSAAARGLMQLIPSTAERMAKVAGKKNFALDDLYEPETAIQLGVLHLDEIRQELSDNLYALAAAYNGGADSVKRWSDRKDGADPDLFVIEIGYYETKEYVYRVMSNYWAYQQIVSERLK